MAQVEHYPIEHQAAHRSRADHQSHPALSSVPAPPGPELDSNYSARQVLPDPPHFSQPPPLADSTLEPSSQTDQDSLGAHLDHHPFAQSADSVPANQDGSEIQSKQRDHQEHAQLESSTAQSADYLVDQHLAEPAAEKPHPTTEPVWFSKLSSDHGDAPSTGLTDRDLQTTGTDPDSTSLSRPEIPPVAKPAAPELTSYRPFESVVDKKPLATSTIKEDPEPLKGMDSKPAIKGEEDKMDLKPGMNSKARSVAEWLDLSKPEVQFALGLFAVPWSSLIITFRSLNQLWYLIFDSPIIEPVTGLLTSIVGPSMVYGSLIALMICLAAELHV